MTVLATVEPSWCQEQNKRLGKKYAGAQINISNGCKLLETINIFQGFRDDISLFFQYFIHRTKILIFLTFSTLSLLYSFGSSRSYLVEFPLYTSSKSSTKWHASVRHVARTKTYGEAQEYKNKGIQRCTALEMVQFGQPEAETWY